MQALPQHFLFFDTDFQAAIGVSIQGARMVNRIGLQMAGITAVFDLDGTVADTAGDLADAANAALLSEGFAAAPVAAIVKSAGYGSRAMISSALSAAGHSADNAQMLRLAAKLVAHYEENIAHKSRLFPGFAEAARLLRASGAKLVLCTNKRERLTLKLLSALGIGDLFEAIAGGDTFPFHKPDPRHISELVRRAGGVLSAAVMIGDSEADIDAARAAGIPVVAVSFGYASVLASELGADAVLNRFDELPALIGALLTQTEPVP
jgi:phosphoglycolate phosphatase